MAWLLAVAASVAGIAVAYLLLDSESGERDESSLLDRPAFERQIIEAGIDRIAAESRGHRAPPPTEAPPPTVSISHLPHEQLTAAPPRPPEGYAFVEHQGAMSKARMAGGARGRERVADSLSWLESPTAIDRLAVQAAAAHREWSFGWIGLAADSTRQELERSLAGSGAVIVGSAGRLIRARLPGDRDRLAAIAALPTVDGLGAIPPEVKLRAFASQSVNMPPHEQAPVYVTLMTGDADGRWKRALTELGAVVGRYDPALRLYAANVTGDGLQSLAAADFVQAIEPIGIVEAALDTAVPAMGADVLRAYDGSPGIFTGTVGASTPIAVMDTGLNVNHLDIASNRSSICGANFAWNSFWFGPDGPLIESDDLWVDVRGHGTHVTGTIAGNGAVETRFAGMAPSVPHIRIAKVLDVQGYGFGDSMPRAMDYFADATGCGDAGSTARPVKPLIVNMSLSGASRFHEGRDAAARKLDATVWSHRQLYVVSQGNSNIHGFSNYGAAKNSLAVGAVLDSGEPAWFTSHGPTADGRLAPSVVATGVGMISARGNGSRGGYNRQNGTSFSSPAVAGVAALLLDAVPAYREQPALARARLMASAVRPDVWLDDSPAFPANNSGGPGTLQAQYGMGKVSARTSVLERDRTDGWTGGSAVAELQDGEYAWQDIVVPPGARRLDLVMTWDEPPADTVASTVLNDLDLWLDRGGDCEEQACGEHASASRIDNVEWIVVTDPEPGTYRAKVLAHRVYTQAPRAALAWTVIRGDSTPALSIETDAASLAANRRSEIAVTLTANAYVAAGTRLHIDCRPAPDSSGCERLAVESMSVSREDGVAVDLSDELRRPVPAGFGHSTESIDFGAPIVVGELAVGETQTVTFTVTAGPAPARLYFTVSAWNATGASAAVDVGAPDPAWARPATPANDHFDAAAVIEGESGSQQLDLLLTTTEPGEPVTNTRTGAPTGSLWYTWTAPASGTYQFSVPRLGQEWETARNDRIDVFSGERITALEPMATGLWGVTFFAERGATYRVRVSSFSRGTPMALTWAPGGRPANDDFAEAELLEGESGDFDGSNAGATLEPGESFGSMTATAWFRWTAPGDGAWLFTVEQPRRVLAFTGESVGALRLVSGFPDREAWFEARQGQEYRIAVADPDTDASSGAYRLSWALNERNTGHDRFESAYPMGNEASSMHGIEIDTRSTVEPGEPEETGVRTKWWRWEAPADGLYTWRLENRGEFVPTYPKLMVSAFAGTAIGDLHLAARAGPGAPLEFILDATGGDTYWLAAGLPAGDATAYEQRNASAVLSWDETPANDEPANAAALSGISGSVQGSNRFATTSRGERTGTVGRASLWWTYQAEASGWVRFRADGRGGPWVLSVHGATGDGSGERELLASNLWQRSGQEVRFLAVEGSSYTIALGTRGTSRGGEFTLSWQETDAPVWLRHVGRLADGERDANGNPVEIRNPGNLAFHDNGIGLYLASTVGLQGFERDPVSGRFALLQSLDGDLERSLLMWDERRGRLLANDCADWRVFESVDGGSSLTDGGELAVTEDPGTCGNELLIDADGAFVYRVASGGMDQFAMEASGELRFVSTHEVSGLRRALIANGGGHLYAITDRNLLVFERDAESGALTRLEAENSLTYQARALAIGDDDAHLFVFDGDGEQTRLYQLEEPANPELLGRLPRFWDWRLGNRPNDCRFAAAREGVVGADAFCEASAFAVHWNSAAEQLEGTDYLSFLQADRYNNALPEFDLPGGMAVSPDGEHLYLSTRRHGLLAFARRPAGDHEAGDPDLVIGSIEVDNENPEPGESVTLRVVVRNDGDGRSIAATTLSYVRSGNEVINARRYVLGTDPVHPLAASGISKEAFEVTPPANPGTYYYGACVAVLSDETDTGNNCSSAVTVEVGGGSG